MKLFKQYHNLLLGRKYYRYGKDLMSNEIFVCTKCGCHFTGDKCPASNCGYTKQIRWWVYIHLYVVWPKILRTWATKMQDFASRIQP